MKAKTKAKSPANKSRASLNIRLTEDEMTQLQDIAANQGMETSAYARQVLKARIGREIARGGNINLPAINDAVNNVGQSKQTGQNGICLFDTRNAKVNPEILQALLDLLNKTGNCEVIGPQDIGYSEAEKLITGE